MTARPKWPEQIEWERQRDAAADAYRERWDPTQRFRLYLVPAGMYPGNRVEVVACATIEAVGPMLELMRAEGEIDPGDRTGILDTAPWEYGHPGDWIVGSLA
jgi:hypothetical protein